MSDGGRLEGGNVKYPCLTKQYVAFNDVRTAKMKRVEWVLEQYVATVFSHAAILAGRDALETVRDVLAEVGG